MGKSVTQIRYVQCKLIKHILNFVLGYARSFRSIFWSHACVASFFVVVLLLLSLQTLHSVGAAVVAGFAGTAAAVADADRDACRCLLLLLPACQNFRMEKKASFKAERAAQPKLQLVF